MEAQHSLLAGGPKFTIIPRYYSKGEYIMSVEEVCLKLPPTRHQQNSGLQPAIYLDVTAPLKPNITKEEASTVKELRKDQSRFLQQTRG